MERKSRKKKKKNVLQSHDLMGGAVEAYRTLGHVLVAHHQNVGRRDLPRVATTQRRPVTST